MRDRSPATANTHEIRVSSPRFGQNTTAELADRVEIKVFKRLERSGGLSAKSPALVNPKPLFFKSARKRRRGGAYRHVRYSSCSSSFCNPP